MVYVLLFQLILSGCSSINLSTNKYYFKNYQSSPDEQYIKSIKHDDSARDSGYYEENTFQNFISGKDPSNQYFRTTTYRAIFGNQFPYYTVGYLKSTKAAEMKKIISADEDNYYYTYEFDCYSIKDFDLIDGKIYFEYINNNPVEKEKNIKWVIVPYGKTVPTKIENYEAVICLRTSKINFYDLETNMLVFDKTIIIKALMKVNGNKLTEELDYRYNRNSLSYLEQKERLIGMNSTWAYNGYLNFTEPRSDKQISSQMYTVEEYMDKEVLRFYIGSIDPNGEYYDVFEEEPNDLHNRFKGYYDFMKSILVGEYSIPSYTPEWTTFYGYFDYDRLVEKIIEEHNKQ